jgi:hypothetical protein
MTNLINLNFFYIIIDKLLNIDLLFIKIISIISSLNFIFIFTIFSVLLCNFFASKKGGEEVIKNIGRIGTGVLAAIGGVDSILNLSDRVLGSDGGSNNTDSDKNKDNKKENNNEDTNKSDENKN